jgi:hypothetical protein
MPPLTAWLARTSPLLQVVLAPFVPLTAKPVVAFTRPLTWRVAPLDDGAKPIPILPLVVSATNKLDVPALFWIWKAVVESAAFWARTVPVNLLLPVKVWGPVPLSKATLEDNLASFKVPEDTLLAFKEVSPEPSPLKELEALEKVLAPVKVWVALSLARLESLDRLAELIWTPLIW